MHHSGGKQLSDTHLFDCTLLAHDFCLAQAQYVYRGHTLGDSIGYCLTSELYNIG